MKIVRAIGTLKIMRHFYPKVSQHFFLFLQDDNQNDSTVWYLLSQIYKARGNTEGI
mgnify:CR=1 FL=1